MNFIVSSTLEPKYEHYSVVRTFDEIKNSQEFINGEGIDVLVIHTFDGKAAQAKIDLSIILEKPIGVLLYICSNPINLIRVMVESKHGRCIDEEFLLDSDEDLDFIVEDIKNSNETSDTSMILSDGSMSVIEEFVDLYKDGKAVSSQAYMDRLETAVADVKDKLDSYSLMLNDVGENVISTFTSLKTIIDQFYEMQEKNKKLVEEMASRSVAPRQSSSTFSSSISRFGQTPIFQNCKIMVFHEFSPCRYLTTFALGYFKYLKIVKNKRVKLIFVAPSSSSIAKKYSEYTNISGENKSISSLYKEEILYINSPTKDVINNAVADGKEVYIFVDRLSAEIPIVKSTSNYAVVPFISGKSDFERFGLKPENCINSVDKIDGVMYTIPSFQNYPSDASSRQSIYLQTQTEIYNKLSALIRL